ncbi:MAG: 2-oxoglutarate dehydrogenase E1 component [Alphaproteobacteria bacterium]|nr:2-oxoglutarate dehydrogenase E1 component [Alphaproteobacteria bacterium SS10]
MSFLTGANADFIANIYQRYLSDPQSVDDSWAEFFAQLNEDGRALLDEMQGASWRDERIANQINDPYDTLPDFAAEAGELAAASAAMAEVSTSSTSVRQAVLDSLRAIMLIRAYRVRGHLEADLDPLGIAEKEPHPELDPKSYGFTDDDMDRQIYLDHVLGLEYATMREVHAVLQRTYCGRIGVEFIHIQDPAQKAWLQERIEGAQNKTDFTERGKKAIYERLMAAEAFEKFLQIKYTGTKRFGLEGGEAMIPAVEQIMKRGGQLGLKEIVIGMAHRGRLNMLTNMMGKPFTAVFSEFQGNSAHPEDVQGSGDVKYHLGTSSDRDFDGNNIHLSLTANPSHLEAVNPVVLGKVRAKQEQRGDDTRTQVMGFLVHGDAAFAGQGTATETMAISDLKGYRTGGCLHFVINNQIGFTTNPNFSRVGPHPTDVALMLQCPIFHVNGDDAEAVTHVARMAIEFRQEFGKDVIIDMVCYRRHGHNEGDEPSFTQPLMYKTIADHPTTRELYAKQLADEGVQTADDSEKVMQAFMDDLQRDFDAAANYKVNKADWLEGKWTGMTTAPSDERKGTTAVPANKLKKIGKVLSTLPDGFKAHSKITRQMKAKAKMLDEGQSIDWATAEALAFGTLVDEGYFVRLSGQDSGRGTFSQRHAVLRDQSTEERYLPLLNIRDGQGHFEVIDSPLSEFAVLGFEYGYSLAEPNALNLWEAQFGDFVNGAQVMIDQFITSAEAKWLRMSGLTMLLPHGYEGNGPEHSSARPERFLAACAEDNIQVVNCTTPANYFHVLRRQVHRAFRKPLIIFTPKSLLRHKACVSPLTMFSAKETFHRVLYEDNKDLAADKKIDQVVLCWGKVYYELAEERDKRGAHNVHILRMEQLYPWPINSLKEQLGRFPNAKMVWCQEEPKNMGPWYFVDRRLEDVLVEIGHKNTRVRYAGRPEAASPATGLLKRHNTEQAALINEALTIEK